MTQVREVNMPQVNFLQVAEDLELAGLFWKPEIGDEVADRKELNAVSILVDPKGMSPSELRSAYIWLPTVEQMICQVEARQAVLFHAGLELSDTAMHYKTVLQCGKGPIESKAETLRLSLALALRNLLLAASPQVVN